jgi:hypothetical protein
MRHKSMERNIQAIESITLQKVVWSPVLKHALEHQKKVIHPLLEEFFSDDTCLLSSWYNMVDCHYFNLPFSSPWYQLCHYFLRWPGLNEHWGLGQCKWLCLSLPAVRHGGTMDSPWGSQLGGNYSWCNQVALDRGRNGQPHLNKRRFSVLMNLPILRPT